MRTITILLFTLVLTACETLHYHHAMIRAREGKETEIDCSSPRARVIDCGPTIGEE